MEQRHEVISIINRLEANAAADGTPVDWGMASVLRLTKYVKIEKVVKLRACHLAAKVDPQVILGPPPVVAVAPLVPAPPPANCDDLYSLKPRKKMAEY